MSSTVSGQIQTYNMPNYVGELYQLTPLQTNFSAMAYANGIRRVAAPEFSWQVEDLPAASQDTKVEGDDATFSGRDRTPRENICQIHQEGVEVSYTKQAATGQLADSSFTGIATDAGPYLGVQPVQNEMSHQLELKVMKVGRDVEYSFINGTYARPTSDASDRQTRGILAAITTNTEAGGAAALTSTMIDSLLQSMFENGAPFNRCVIFANYFQKQAISNIYGYAPESRNVGGLNIMQLETQVGNLGIILNRYVPTDTLLFAEMSEVIPVHLEIPGKGVFFTEPLAKTGSADKMQLYGEIGLQYGPEEWHGKITGLATS